MTSNVDEFHINHDRNMRRLIAQLGLYANEPIPETDADCRRLIAMQGHKLAQWQLDTLRRWCHRQHRA